MGFNHVSLTEYYQGYTEDVFDSRPLSFTMFPVLGWAVTHSEIQSDNGLRSSRDSSFHRKQDQQRDALHGPGLGHCP